MLRLSPNEFLNFSKGDGSDSNVEITSISKIPVIYKIQTTSPEKFRVRPRSGVLNPSETVSVSIFLKAEHHLSESSKDKFLIMCMPVPQGTDLTAQPMSELWKHKQFNSPEVEQHRLCCVYKSTTEYARNGYSGNEMSDGKGLGKEGTVNDLSRHATQLEKHLKLTQILQGVTIVFLLILSMAMVYMVKLQSQDNATPQANILDMTSCPMGRKH